MNYVYLLRCADNTLYSGWTNDLSRRLAAHNTGSAGAKYTKSRRPVRLVYCEAYDTRGEAMRREAAMKKLPRIEKQRLADAAAGSDGEFLTVYDAKRQPCGVLPRAMVHRCGLLHRVVHLHVFETRDGVPGLWLQQRSLHKRAAPGAYDWAATGHVAAGERPPDAVCREAQEECGLSLSENCLRPAGEQRVRTVYAPDFVDDELAVSFACFADRPPEFSPGPEVLRMVWASCDALNEALAAGAHLPVTAADGVQDRIPAALLSRGPAEWQQVCRALHLPEPPKPA